jgi:DNA-binding transcriptional LysR family regulator
MLPSALGRHVRLLEESLGSRLLLRTTRNVMLSQDGMTLLNEARNLIAKADELGAATVNTGASGQARCGSAPSIPPLPAAWVRGSRDPLRDEPLAMLQSRLVRYASEA